MVIRADWEGAIDPLLGTMPDSVLARRIGCSAETIQARRQTKGIPAYRKVTDEMIRQWIDWEIEGVPQSEMAKRSGVNPTTIWSHLKKAFNKPKFGKYSHLFRDEWEKTE